MAADIEAEDVELGGDALSRVQVAQLARRDKIRHAVIRGLPAKQVQNGPASPPRRPVKHPDPGKQVPPGR